MAYDWRGLLLEALSCPLSEVNVDALQWWADSEGMPLSENNWLATTIGGFGGVVVNGVGVKAYPSVQAGVDATAATLRGGAYRNVINALQDGNSLQEIWSAVNSSPWCSHCQNGLYPIVLFQHLGAVLTGPPPPAPGPPSGSYSPTQQNQAAAAWSALSNQVIGGTNKHLSEFDRIISVSRRARK